LASLLTIRLLAHRLLLLLGTMLCGIAHLVTGITYTVDPNSITTGKTLVVTSFIFIFSYSGSVGPYAWLVAMETSSSRLRAWTVGLGAAMNFILGWVVTFTAPYFVNPANLNWGPKYAFVWFGSCAWVALFIVMVLPETKDRTLEESDEMWGVKRQEGGVRVRASTESVGSQERKRKEDLVITSAETKSFE
jgi:MFS transporter, SP family, sugar:H+ symporter